MPDPHAPQLLHSMATVEDAAVNLAAQDLAAQAQLVAAIWADPAKLVAVAIDAGIQDAHFSERDLRGLFIVAVHCRSLSRGLILHAAEVVLRKLGHWHTGREPLAPGDGSSAWDRRKLEWLADRYPPGASWVRRFARELLDIIARIQRATALLAEARGILELASWRAA